MPQEASQSVSGMPSSSLSGDTAHPSDHRDTARQSPGVGRSASRPTLSELGALFNSPTKMVLCTGGEENLTRGAAWNQTSSPLNHSLQRHALSDAGQHLNRSACNSPQASPFKTHGTQSPHRAQFPRRPLGDNEPSENCSPGVTPTGSMRDSAFCQSPLRPQQQGILQRAVSMQENLPSPRMAESCASVEQGVDGKEGEPAGAMEDLSEPLLVRLCSATGLGCTNCLNIGSRSGRGVWSTRAGGRVEVMESHCVIEVRSGTTLPMLYVSVTPAEERSTPKWLTLSHANALDEPFVALVKPKVSRRRPRDSGWGVRCKRSLRQPLCRPLSLVPLACGEVGLHSSQFAAAWRQGGVQVHI